MSGDYQLEDTVYLPFTTRALTGIPTVLVSGVVEIYEDASLTQITAAETLTVSLDSVVGFNMCSVVATAANGFGSGQSYTAILSAGTVNSVSVVGEVIGQFTIEMSAAAKDLANGTDGLGAIKGDSAAILTDTGTTLPASIATVDSNVDAILVDTAEIGAAGAGLTALATQASVNTLDTNVDAILVDTGTTLPATLSTIDGNVDSILADTGTDGVLVAMSQALPGTPTADTVGDALKQSTYEEKPKRGSALSNIAFKMVSSSDNKTGVASLSASTSPQTLFIQYAQDGDSAWTTGGGTIVEVGDGIYKYNATSGEMTADIVIFRFTGTGANAREIAVTTVT